jgi:MFS family permease
VSVAVPPRSATSLGRRFTWLWAAYAVSTFGTWVAFDAFPILAITQLHVGPAAVSALAAVGMAVAALIAVPLGPWVERRPKRPVMMAMDLVRLVALLTVPAAFALGGLTFAQLMVVSVVLGAADIAFRAASGAFLKGLVAREGLLVANARFESTTWTATALGPPLGGAAIGALGAVTTVVANAVSFGASALALRAIGPEAEDEASGARAEPQGPTRLHRADLFVGWHTILGDRDLRALFLNNLVVSALILAPGPSLAVLMLGELGFSPLEYALAFGAPCVGGLIGARLSRRLLARVGERRLLLVVGTLRACWPIGLALVSAGAGGLALVLVVQLGLVTCMGIFNPVLATVRLERTPDDRVARTLAAWNVSTNATRAALTALWGVLAALTSARAAVAVAGGLLLLTPLLLARYRSASK